MSRSHAIVIGSGISGLLLARALSDHFEQVTVLEKDGAGDFNVIRKGVPQAHHGHLLLAGGLQASARLFPGFEAELLAADAKRLEVSKDFLMLGRYGWELRYATGIRVLSCTRTLLENTIRHRIESVPNVKFIYGSSIIALDIDERFNSVTGVIGKFGQRDHDEGVARTLPADLVVIATGQHGRVSEWLRNSNIPQPPTITAPADIGYASRVIKLKSKPKDWVYHLVSPIPGVRLRGGLLCPIEGENRYICSLFGISGDHPSIDEIEHYKFASTIEGGIFAQALAEAESESRIYAYKMQDNVVRFPHLVENWPSGLILSGDCAAQFNPRFAQGMTMAAISAERLAFHLKNTQYIQLPKWEQRFHFEQVQNQKNPWFFATMQELGMPAPNSNIHQRVSDFARSVHHKMLLSVFRNAPLDRNLSYAIIKAHHYLLPLETVLKPSFAVRISARALGLL